MVFATHVRPDHLARLADVTIRSLHHAIEEQFARQHGRIAGEAVAILWRKVFPGDVRDMVLKTGMEKGAAISYDRLEEVAKELEQVVERGLAAPFPDPESTGKEFK